MLRSLVSFFLLPLLLLLLVVVVLPSLTSGGWYRV